MDMIIANVVIGFAVLLFGAMAIFPFMVESKPARRTPFTEDDQVLSIQPVGVAPQGLRPVAPLGTGQVDAPGSGHRHAA